MSAEAIYNYLESGGTFEDLLRMDEDVSRSLCAVLQEGGDHVKLIRIGNIEHALVKGNQVVVHRDRANFMAMGWLDPATREISYKVNGSSNYVVEISTHLKGECRVEPIRKAPGFRFKLASAYHIAGYEELIQALSRVNSEMTFYGQSQRFNLRVLESGKYNLQCRMTNQTGNKSYYPEYEFALETLELSHESHVHIQHIEREDDLILDIAARCYLEQVGLSKLAEMIEIKQ